MRHPNLWMGLLLWSVFNPAYAAWTVNMSPGATEVSHAVFDLHMTIFWICVVIGIIVFGAMLWSIIAHRRSTGQQAATFHESTKVEILWTVVPLIILIVMAIPATRTLINIYDNSDSDIDIQITGYQWKWHYKYLGQDVEFFSNLATPADQIRNQAPKSEHYLLEVDEPLVLPIGAKIRFLVTSADVIHSCGGCRRLRSNAMPFRIYQRGLDPRRKTWPVSRSCAELCGKDHGFMPIVVDVKTRPDYDAWLAERKAQAAQLKELTSKEWTLEELMARGDKVYHTTCRPVIRQKARAQAADVPRAQRLAHCHWP